jgi:acetyl coenzyme A synthetase (ADP forming)-like protein
MRYVPTPYQGASDFGRLVLRDGTTAHIRRATPADQAELSAFFNRLSPEARRHRFSSMSQPSSNLISTLCAPSNATSVVTLLVTRNRDGATHIIATGSYLNKAGQTAEVAFAVDDAFHGKGLGTLLLERLALLAVQSGFTRFWAVTHADNRAMLNVFRESGFEVHERAEASEVTVDLALRPTETTVNRQELRDRISTTASLRRFFRPCSVAVVGASRDPTSVGYRLVENLVTHGFCGPVYAINPKATAIAGVQAHASLRDLRVPIDLALIAVPADIVPRVVDDCAAAGVSAVVVISAGFAEVGGVGIERQAKLVQQVRGHGMRLIGPNCMGLLNTDSAVKLNATFVSVAPPAGRIAMSSQSGALGLAVLAAANRLNLGFSTFVSVGNKADVSGNDLLQYWEEDDATDVILLYLESFGKPRRFGRIARRVSYRKPVVALKSGQTSAGIRAAGSHTAALASNNVAVDALFRQTGVIRAATLEEMFDLARMLSMQPLPQGKRVGVVTNAGGPGILCTDACETGGLLLPSFSASLRARLTAFLPAAASLANPVDLIATATPEHYLKVVEAVLNSHEIDSLIVIHTSVGPDGGEATANAIVAGVATAQNDAARTRPVLACWLAPNISAARIALAKQRIPCFEFPESGARALARAATYADWRSQPPGVYVDFENLDLETAHNVCQQAFAQSDAGWLSAEATRTVLKAMGLPLPRGGFARNADQAAAIATQIGFPVAVKLASRRIVHKTDIGGISLNLPDVAAVRGAFETIRSRVATIVSTDAMDGVVVQPMLEGVEVLVGVTQDPLFGPLIAFGLGGIHVEILEGVVFRVAPLTERDASDMVKSARGYRLLKGYRGHPPADIPAIEEALLRLSRLAEEVPEISELDLNPIFVGEPGQGCQIADARIHLRRPTDGNNREATL